MNADLPPYEEASTMGIRELRGMARERKLAAHRRIGGMGTGELLAMLYPETAPSPYTVGVNVVVDPAVGTVVDRTALTLVEQQLAVLISLVADMRAELVAARKRLDDMDANLARINPQPEDLLDAQQVANLLGIAVNSVRSWTHDPRTPMSYRVGTGARSPLRWKRSEVLAWAGREHDAQKAREIRMRPHDF